MITTVRTLPSTLPDIQSKEGYDAAIRSKVKKTFNDNIGAISVLATLTLPIFFIAWPVALAIAFEGAKIEVDGAIACHRLEFVRDLSQKLSAKKNTNSEQVLEEFLKENNREFTTIFSKNTRKADVIRLAQVYGSKYDKDSELQATKKPKKKDAISFWKKLIREERKIQSYITNANSFYRVTGDTDYRSTATSWEKVVMDNICAQDNYNIWSKDSPSDKRSITNAEILRKITKQYGIKLDHLNMITSYIVSIEFPDVEGKNAIVEAHAKARLLVLEILESIYTPNILNSTGPLGMNKHINNLLLEYEGKYLSYLQIILGVKLIQSLNETSSRQSAEAIINEEFTKIALEPTRLGLPEVDWTHQGRTITLPEQFIGDIARTAHPLILTRTDTPMSPNDIQNDTVIKRKAAEAAWEKLNTLQHCTTKNMTLEEAEAAKAAAKKDAISAVFEYILPVMTFIDEIAQECKMTASQKASLTDRIMSVILQEYPNFITGNLSANISEHPNNKIGLPHSKGGKPQDYFMQRGTENVDELGRSPPIQFQFNPGNKSLMIEFRSVCPTLNSFDMQNTPMKIQQVTQLTIDLTDGLYAPTCKILGISPKIDPVLAAPVETMTINIDSD